MNKMLAVLKREYLAAVRRKMFIVMCFLLPFLMAALIAVPGLLLTRGLGEKKVAVLDGTGQLRDAYVHEEPAKGPQKGGQEGLQKLRVEYVDRHGDESLDKTAKPYLARLSSEKKSEQLDAVLLVPAAALSGEDENAQLKFYSSSAADFVTEERLSSMTNKAIHRYRLATHGVSGEALDTLMREVKVDAVQYSKSGEEKKGGGANFLVIFVFAALLVLPSFVYGTEIMRGIVQEKTDRVVEVLISSMKPIQLLTGKVLGIAAVGLTQIAVWTILSSIAGGGFGATLMAVAGDNIMQFLRPALFVNFVIFFVLAYLTYVCVYAISGAICNSDREAQQLVAPISIVMMLPWFMMVAIITNPDSKLVTGLSMAPVFGPITMFVRTLVAEPPAWQYAVSVLVSVATIAVFFWCAAKIFRVGILSYGKRPTVPELWRWLKVA